MSFNKEKKGSYGRNLLLMLLLTAITFAVILSGNDMENLIQALKTSRFMWLLAGFVCMFISVPSHLPPAAASRYKCTI